MRRFPTVPEAILRRIRPVAQAVMSVGVRTKIIGIVLGVTVLLGSSVIALVRSSVRDQLVADLHETGGAIATDVAATVSLQDAGEGQPVLPPTLSNEISHHDNLVFVAYAPDGATGFTESILLADREESEMFVRDLSAVGPSHDHGSTVDDTTIHVFRSPARGAAVGTIAIGVSQASVDRSIRVLTLELLALVGAVAIAGELGAGVLTWYLTRPLQDLVNLTERVSDGDLSVSATPWSSDELGTLAVSFNQMTKSLQQARAKSEESERIRRSLVQELLTVQEDERQRISRLLHDSLGQRLGSLSIALSQLTRSPEAAEERLPELREIAVRALEQVREMSHELRPAALDALGLGAALRRHAEEYEQSTEGLSINVRMEFDDRLPGSVETTLYRVIQEALTNAVRHSRASTIGVHVSRFGDGVRAIVEDDGVGFDSESVAMRSTVGLQSMRERSQMIGGTIQVETTSSGTTVFIEVPI